jgi:hypothetical protein
MAVGLLSLLAITIFITDYWKPAYGGFAFSPSKVSFLVLPLTRSALSCSSPPHIHSSKVFDLAQDFSKHLDLNDDEKKSTRRILPKGPGGEG